jgi:hypothetical protein
VARLGGATDGRTCSEGRFRRGGIPELSAELLNGDEDMDCDVIVCSDDPNATQVAMELAAKIAARAHD